MNKGASYGKKHTVPTVPDCDLPLEADRDIKIIPSVMSITDRIGIAGLVNYPHLSRSFEVGACN